MSLRGKFTIAFMSIALLVFIVGGIGLHAGAGINRKIQNLNNSIIPSIISLSHMRVASYRIHTTLQSSELLLSTNTGDQDEVHKTIAEKINIHEKELLKQLEIYTGRAGNDPKLHPQARELEVLVQQQHVLVGDLLDEILGSNNLNARKNLWSLLKKTHEKIEGVIELASTKHISVLQSQQVLAEQLLTKATYIHYVISIVSFLFAIILALSLAHTLSRPILQLRNAVKRVGRGIKRVEVDSAASGELHDLVEAFNSMTQQLEETSISKEYFENIINSMLDALFVLDDQGKVLMVNSSFCNLLSYSKEELAKQSISKFVDKNSLLETEGFIPLMERFVKGSLELSLLSRDGNRIPVLMSYSTTCINDLSKNYICVAKDLRDKKQAEEKLQDYQLRVKHNEQLAALGAMSGMVAHKLSQPLSAMRLFLQQSKRVLKTDLDKEVLINNLEDCLSEIKKVDATVRELLSYTRRPDRHSKELVSLSDVIEKTKMLLRKEAQRVNMQINAENLDDIPLFKGRQDELEELFYLLIRNAIEAAPADEASQLMITTTIEEGYVIIKIQDNCGGISEENLPKIFDMFFTTKPRGVGTGLGLNICKQIVDNHDGKISVDSELGKGTEFTVRIPLYSNESGAVAAE